MWRSPGERLTNGCHDTFQRIWPAVRAAGDRTLLPFFRPMSIGFHPHMRLRKGRKNVKCSRTNYGAAARRKARKTPSHQTLIRRLDDSPLVVARETWGRRKP